MIIGVISDTHGNLELIEAAADFLHGQLRAGLVFHLGDDYRDASGAARAGMPVLAVPGLWCPEYNNPKTPRRLIETVDGLDIACAHAQKDLLALGLAAAICLTGHTHEYNIALLGRSLHVNPGHLKSAFSKGQPPSFAAIHIEPESVRAVIHAAYGGQVLEQTEVSRSLLG